VRNAQISDWLFVLQLHFAEKDFQRQTSYEILNLLMQTAAGKTKAGVIPEYY